MIVILVFALVIAIVIMKIIIIIITLNDNDKRKETPQFSSGLPTITKSQQLHYYWPLTHRYSTPLPIVPANLQLATALSRQQPSNCDCPAFLFCRNLAIRLKPCKFQLWRIWTSTWRTANMSLKHRAVMVCTLKLGHHCCTMVLTYFSL